MTSVLFWRMLESTGSDGFPSFIHVIVGFKLLPATQGIRTGNPIRAVSRVGGRTSNRRRDNITSWMVSSAAPKIFSALQKYIPPSSLVTLLIFKAPLLKILLSGKLPIALDHVIVGGSWPVTLQAMATVCPSSAISWLEEIEIWGATVEAQLHDIEQWFADGEGNIREYSLRHSHWAWGEYLF